MKVKFLSGFQGRETRNIWYEAGKVVELDDDMAFLVVAERRAVFVDEEGQEVVVDAQPQELPVLSPAPEPEQAPKPKSKPKGKKRGGR